MNEKNREHLEKKVLDNSPYVGFFVNRVPQNVFLDFKKLAKNEHCNDYGLTLKTLVDVYNEKKILFKLLKDKINELSDKDEQDKQMCEKI